MVIENEISFSLIEALCSLIDVDVSGVSAEKCPLKGLEYSPRDWSICWPICGHLEKL